MASISSQPIRSISLPPRSHPTSQKIEETIIKLKSRVNSDQSTTYCSGSKNVQISLLSLIELHSHVQELIISVSTEQGKVLEQALESSVTLLDACSSARDLVSGLKERVRDLESAIRRKGYSSCESEIKLYLSFRKKVAKDVGKCLKLLKQTESKCESIGDDPCLANLVGVFKEVYCVSDLVLRELFLFLSSPMKASSGWSLISRLVIKNPGSKCKTENEVFNEVSRVDLALIEITKIDGMELGGRIQALESSLEIFEGELGCLYRCLLKNRVSLLNIFTN